MPKRNSILPITLLLTFCLIVAACGSRPSADDSGTGETSAGSSTGSTIAAMPTASFKSVGEQSNITTTIELEESDEEDQAAAIALGERVYDNKCAECHGPSGEGSGDAPTIAGTSLSFEEFEDLLRTGGEIGPDHLFGTQAVSANGVAGLHAFLVDVGQ